MYCPRRLFLIPGVALITAGIAAYAVGLPGTTIRHITFGAHTLLFGSLAILCGYQAILFAVFTKIFAIAEGLIPEDRRVKRFFEVFKLETGLCIGALAMLSGMILLGISVNLWRLADFGPLDYGSTMRWVIPGSTLTALGFQTILSSFFSSILGMKRK
jgi:hypothetical protein